MKDIGKGLIGTAVDRVEGPAKVAGTARYALDGTAPGMLWGHLVTSRVAAGRLLALDTGAASRSPGVVAVYSPFAPLPIPPLPSVSNPSGARHAPLADPVVHHHGQPVALVVADTPERARAAAASVIATYAAAPAVTGVDAGPATVPGDVEHGEGADIGYSLDGRTVAQALADSDMVVSGRYRTAAQTHVALEPHSTLAWWTGDRLHVRTGHQAIPWLVGELAATFGLDPADIDAVVPHVGGGFGGKTRAGVDVKLACAASKVLGRPVKIVLTRAQVFTATVVRGMTDQRITLGARRDGRLTAIRHHSRSAEAAVLSDLLVAPGHAVTRMLYGADAMEISQRGVTVNLPRTGFMRGPSEVPGLFALETAMDELAHRLGIDPVELRLRNDTPVYPGTDLPWSAKRLATCLRVGAERFGWDERPREPGARREGDHHVGFGMAVTAYRAVRIMPVTVAVTLRADGCAEVATSAVDLGTGMATAIAITAADALDIPIDRVRPRLGDSALPPGGVALGSTGTASVTPAVAAAARAAMDEVLACAAADPRSPAYERPAGAVTVCGGTLRAGATAVPFAEALSSAGRSAVTGTGATAPRGAFDGGRAHWSFGAHFCEVRVHRLTREPRVTRMLGVMDIGRVVNAKAARGQIIGGMVWGLSTALFEGLDFDPRGAMANGNLADYLVPVNADVPDIDVVLLDEPDDAHNELGVRGAGEIGAGGVSAAIGNAIHNAAGIRLRDVPMTIDRMWRGTHDHD
ncbi:xanthine dehydrogenase family protein molybdopterin-binding subunit [Streptomyces radicis]|uniref:Xanthine dehydrogenase family protein molybdopterin-binding subunit n=1 Tax=Streptomyces radicis TaxID=1750517 RepID=A0A3A9VUQ9_9ACTN|nr:xanthine dehydrogenase family protein molybdopterin-binding subunit [Streptomyces radicis]RKN04252.1 xanthine dehydrogenase family protein molybdopterin-binding subunit [Streptomyces radicis]RKN14770.1 xanthine dehydrogenase family protein molybdopterin-binding subunit [Streptomyces radicis]